MLAAGGIAVIQLMIMRLKPGLAFTIPAIMMCVCVPLLLAEKYHGVNFRQARGRVN